MIRRVTATKEQLAVLNTLRPETRGRPTQDQILRAAQETGLYVAPRQPGGLSRYNRARRDEKWIRKWFARRRAEKPKNATNKTRAASAGPLQRTSSFVPAISPYLGTYVPMLAQRPNTARSYSAPELPTTSVHITPGVLIPDVYSPLDSDSRFPTDYCTSTPFLDARETFVQDTTLPFPPINITSVSAMTGLSIPTVPIATNTISPRLLNDANAQENLANIKTLMETLQEAAQLRPAALPKPTRGLGDAMLSALGLAPLAIPSLTASLCIVPQRPDPSPGVPVSFPVRLDGLLQPADYSTPSQMPNSNEHDGESIIFVRNA